MFAPAVAAVLVLLLGACKQSSAGHDAPASVANPRTESDLTTIRLTEQAEQRLGIVTVAVEERDVPRTRLVGGEIVIPPGGSLVVNAPLAGALLAPTTGVPGPGAPVDAGQPVFRLVVIPGDGSIASVREAVAVAEAQARLTRTRAERVNTLRGSNLVSEEELDVAQANAAAAEAALAAARARLSLAQGGSTSESLATALPPIVITSPTRGVIRRLSAAAEQRVAAGAPLFEVQATEALWVRVPVYVGDLDVIDQASAVGVHFDPGGGARPVVTARPVRAPPTADPVAASADLFYELRGGPLVRPGQRVSVELPLRGRSRQLVVPWSAVVYDINGSTWIYENTEPHVFVRRRVEIAWVAGNLAVLARGPAAGTRAVTEGAAELFGTEFGGAK